MQKGTTSRMMVASRPKVGFWPDGSTSPRNYGNNIISDKRSIKCREQINELSGLYY
jgi:hypothetical protein